VNKQQETSSTRNLRMSPKIMSPVLEN